jgi:dTDP-4-amino-4,6-dideoxygalactose transaminase
MRVPLVDMQARIAPLRDEMVRAMTAVLDRGVYVMGPECTALEEEFARFCGAEHAVAVSSGTAALQLALLALDVGPGDEVITVSHSFFATAEAISTVGAIPVFVDIEPDSLLMDPTLLERAWSTRTKAIVPVHIYGLMCDMDPIMEFARRRGLSVIEDACQAHGATHKGRVAGSIGDAGCFSFYPAKNVGAVGEGGIITTQDERIAARARELRSHGEVQRYVHRSIGWNFRLSELQAATTRVQLRHADEWNAGRRKSATRYQAALGADSGIELQASRVDREHVYHVFVALMEHRDYVRRALEAKGISTGVHYPAPIHRQEAYRAPESCRFDALPVTESVASRVLSLPMYPELTPEQIDYVAAAIRASVAEAGNRDREPVRRPG